MPDAPAHGGRLIAMRTAFPQAPTPWIDLSTGISPFAYPFAQLPQELIARLPEPEQEARLRRIAAIAYGAPDMHHVGLAPGSQMLISLLPTLLSCRAAAILSPTYAEHEASWLRAGAEPIRVGSVADLLDAAGPDTALVICTPNNPDGRRIAPDQIRTLSQRCDAVGGWLIVDEAYADLDPPPAPMAGLLADIGRLLVLRSFGKGYGLAGLRLGFLIGQPGMVRAMADLMGPWPVSGPAIAIGTQALADTSWRTRAALRARKASSRLDGLLAAASIVAIGGTSLFRLSSTHHADRIWHGLAEAGILVRRFADQPTWLRFGLPPDEQAWARLDAALTTIAATAGL